jgi:MFS family permease
MLLVIYFLIWKFKDEWADSRGERFDAIGSVIYCIALVSLIYGFSQLPFPLGIGLVVTGGIGFAVFIFWETKTSIPILDTHLFRHNRVFVFSSLAALINYSATFAVAFLLSLYLQYIKGFSPPLAGTVLIAQPVMQALFSPIAGRLSDKIRPQIVSSIGMSITGIGLVLLVFINDETGLGFIIASLLLLGFGFGLFVSPNTNAIMSSVEKKYYGVASAIVSTMRQVGMMFSMGIVMVIFALYIGKMEITPDLYPQFVTSVQIAFVIFAILCFGGVLASLARGKASPVQSREST